jgi:hypothetical protein
MLLQFAKASCRLSKVSRDALFVHSMGAMRRKERIEESKVTFHRKSLIINGQVAPVVADVSAEILKRRQEPPL